MKNANKFALALLAMSPLAVSAMDIGLTMGLKGSFDIYNGEKLDFSEYKKPLVSSTTGTTYSLAGSEITLDKNFGMAGSLSAGAILMDMVTIEVEGGYAMSFMQKGTDTDTSGLTGNIGTSGASATINGTNAVALKDKEIVAFRLPYILASGYFSMEIPDTGIVPYIGGGIGAVFANLSFDDNNVAGEITGASSGTAQDIALKDALKAEGDFKYVVAGIFHGTVGCGYKISDEMIASIGYRLIGGFSDIEYKNDKVEDNIIKSKLLKHSILGNLRYTMSFDEGR